MHMKVPPINNTPATVKQGSYSLILTNSLIFQEKNTAIPNVFNNLL